MRFCWPDGSELAFQFQNLQTEMKADGVMYGRHFDSVLSVKNLRCWQMKNRSVIVEVKNRRLRYCCFCFGFWCAPNITYVLHWTQQRVKLKHKIVFLLTQIWSWCLLVCAPCSCWRELGHSLNTLCGVGTSTAGSKLLQPSDRAVTN